MTASILADRAIEHALVLGGTGFIGTPLVRRLAAAGVRTTCLLHRRPLPNGNATVIRGSLERVPWRALEADPPDVIFHLARIPGRGGMRGIATRLRNRLANERMLLALAAWPRPPLVIFVGGTLAYGSHGENAVTEETPLTPTSFSRNYHAAELPWLRAMRGNDAPVIVARPAWVLGSGSWFEFYFRRMMKQEGAVPLYGDGKNWMSIVHVDDCAGLLEHVARRAAPMSAVNLFGWAPIRQEELVARLERISGLPVHRVSFEDLERRFGRAVRQAFDFSARIETVHYALHAEYQREHQDLDQALSALLVGG